MRYLTALFVLVVCSVASVCEVSTAKKTSANSQLPSSPSEDPSSSIPNPAEGAQRALASLPGENEQFPADYIPCVFTTTELLALRLEPLAATLSSADAEKLKQNLISQASFQEGTKALTASQKAQFFLKIAYEHFEGLTPSQAIARVIKDLNEVSQEDLLLAARGGGSQLVSLARSRLPLQLAGALGSEISEKIGEGLENSSKAGSEQLGQNEIRDDLFKLANNANTTRVWLNSEGRQGAVYIRSDSFDQL